MPWRLPHGIRVALVADGAVRAYLFLITQLQV